MRRLVFSAALAAFAAPALATSDACYDDAAIRKAVAVHAELSLRSEQLTRLAIAENVSGEHVYVLGRQMVLIERIHRRLLERGGCAAGADALERDLAIMKRVFSAFASGDGELKIAALQAEQAQALLSEIARFTGELESEIGKLAAMHR
jgi:hypothetical protein